MPFEPEEKTLLKFSEVLQRSGASESILKRLTALIVGIKEDLARSETFSQYDIYGASLLIVFTSTGDVRGKIIDLGNFVERGKKVDDTSVDPCPTLTYLNPMSIKLICVPKPEWLRKVDHSHKRGFFAALENLSQFIGNTNLQKLLLAKNA